MPSGLPRALGAAAAILSGAATLVVTLAGLLLASFIIGRVVPIDPVVAVVGDKASQETYVKARAELGLDRPVWVQFGRYITEVARGDLGRSSLTGRPVAEDIARVFPATLELSTLAIIIGLVIGLPLGVYAAHRRNHWPDHLVRCLSLVGYSTPVFWLGLLGLLVFYAKLGWIGGPGRLDTAYRYTVEEWSGLVLVDTLRSGDWGALRNALLHIVLPALLLGYFSLAYIARMVRGFMIEELGKEYVMVGRIKGASEARVLWRHALPNALVPILTVVALAYGYLLEGTVLTETVFAWPGLGLYITNSLFSADMPAVLGGTLVVGISFVLLNKLSELAYPILDPRTRGR
jgi:peptide/nickel transport system permease protein